MASRETARRAVLAAMVAGACLLAIAVYLATTGPSDSGDAPRSEPPPGATAQPAHDGGSSGPTAADVRSAPYVGFRSARPQENGRIGLAALDGPDARRITVGDLVCDRVYFAHGHGICLQDNREHGDPPALAILLDGDFHRLHTIGLPGHPSRARMSPDGKYAATTVFVSGESYTSGFSTRSHIIDFESGTIVADLEQLTVLHEGREFRRRDFNFWGITFARDSNLFYATLRTGDTTYLVRGDLAARRVVTLRENVECPSLSPDETRIAYKSRISPDATNAWRVHVLDLATLRDTPIAETRSVDDQVEWLDDDHLIYGITEDTGLPEDAVNVWSSSVQVEGGAPSIFIHAASSPTVVR